MKTALVTIATGRYTAFIEQLARSLVDLGARTDVLVLTDAVGIAERRALERCTSSAVRIRVLPWGSMPWPYPTLWRYAAMAAYSDVLLEYDSIVYSDADMRFVGDVGALWSATGVVAVEHPGHRGAESASLPLERRTDSAAYVHYEHRGPYVCGGVQGGETEMYLSAIRSCRDAILADFVNGVTAVWHDESHWNRWVAENSGTEILDSGYCWPESWVRPADMSVRLLALDKDHHALRGTRPKLNDRGKDVGRLLRSKASGLRERTRGLS